LVLAGVGWPALAGALAGVALGLVPLLIFNLLTFGMPLGPQVAVNYPGMSASLPGALLARRAPILMTMLVDGTGLQLGWLLAAFAIACAAAWSERWRAWLLAAAAAACLAYLYGPTAHLLHTGVLATCPFILIALAALRPALFRQPPSRLVLVVGLVFMVGVLLTTPNDGGAQWGPRYLLPALTLLVVVGLAGLSHAGPAPRLARRAALALLLAAGLTVQAQGVQFLQDSTTKSLRVVQVVNAQPAQPVLTDIWYAPQLLAPLYVERTILYLYRPEQMPAFSAMLRQRGILRFSYLTAQPWERDSQLPSGSGATCTRLEGLWYGLNLLDCTIVL
ncbi:MAG: hypothetical protein HGA65_15405, partial [Oscillochloris sp.]|nr:hypothetical protein [Oscillochloris sp.]